MKNLLNNAFALLIVFAFAGFLSACNRTPQTNVNVPAARENLKSANAETRQNAAIELAKAGPAAAPAVQDLIPLLKDPDPLVRRLSAYALGEIGPQAKPAIPHLQELMKEPDRDIALAGVNALNAIDPSVLGGMQVPNVTN
jgi:HEAT repeat protein